MTSVQIIQLSHNLRKQCPACKKMFTPDPRVAKRQKYCSKKECQTKRQRLNEHAWVKEEENQKFRSAQQRRWRKSHQGYMKQWREDNPESVGRNREFMRAYMRRKRQDILFEKSKEWHLQVSRDKGVMYVSRGKTWILTRLKRASRLSKAISDGYAYKHVGSLRLPRGRMYRMFNDP